MDETTFKVEVRRGVGQRRAAAACLVAAPAVALEQAELQDAVADEPRGRLRLDGVEQLAGQHRLAAHLHRDGVRSNLHVDVARPAGTARRYIQRMSCRYSFADRLNASISATDVDGMG